MNSVSEGTSGSLLIHLGVGATNCTDCDSGKFAALAGAASCDTCNAGTHQALAGATTCLPCDEGEC